MTMINTTYTGCAEKIWRLVVSGKVFTHGDPVLTTKTKQVDAKRVQYRARCPHGAITIVADRDWLDRIYAIKINGKEAFRTGDLRRWEATCNGKSADLHAQRYVTKSGDEYWVAVSFERETVAGQPRGLMLVWVGRNNKGEPEREAYMQLAVL